MAEKAPTSLRKGRFAPYGLLSPGMLWLILFFLVPMWTLLRIAVGFAAAALVGSLLAAASAASTPRGDTPSRC